MVCVVIGNHIRRFRVMEPSQVHYKQRVPTLADMNTNKRAILRWNYIIFLIWRLQTCVATYRLFLILYHENETHAILEQLKRSRAACVGVLGDGGMSSPPPARPPPKTLRSWTPGSISEALEPC